MRWEGHKPAHRSLHGALLCYPRSGEVLLHPAELALVVQFYNFLDGPNRITVAAVALLTRFCDDAGGFDSDKAFVCKLEDVLLDRVRTHTNGLTDGFVTGIALISFAIFTVEQVRIDSDFSGR